MTADRASALYLVAGLIHLLPVPGMLGADWLGRLYGIELQGGDLVLLMRHRALLFGLLGGLLVAAAFRPALRLTALAAGLPSASGFLLLAGWPGGLSDALWRVWLADLVAVAALLGALALRLANRPARPAGHSSCG